MFSKRHKEVVYISKYILAISLFLIGIVLAVNSYYDVSASYMVFLFIVPLIMLIRPIVMNSFIIAASCIYLFLMYKLEDTVLFSKNCTNAIIFGISSIMVGTSMTTMRFQKYKTDRLNRKLMKIDILTELFNRHAYTDLMKSYSKKELESDLIYISLDLNGLKARNDSLGHTAGDELLCAAAECMKTAFEDFGKIFRIGGDEFAVIFHGTEQHLNSAIEVFNKTINSYNKVKNDTLSISKGYVFAKDYENCTFEELAHFADVKMYEDKREYYQKSGIERRK